MHSDLSRRTFFRIAAGATAAATVPLLTEPQLASAQRIRIHHALPPGAVRIDANENPLGPCRGACAVMTSLIPEGGRYDDDLTEKLISTFSAMEGLKEGYVLAYAGSTEPLNYSVLAFTSPERSYVTADPGYEAGMYAAAGNGAKVVKVPLTKDHAHDVRAMIAADPNAGVFYICNPNNPTGTITSPFWRVIIGKASSRMDGPYQRALPRTARPSAATTARAASANSTSFQPMPW